MNTSRYLAALAVVSLLPVVAHAQINMGMVGDSITDDYLGGPAQTNNNLAALSWGQILAETRGEFNFGNYLEVGTTWDDSAASVFPIRYSGYEYNWATSGGVASDNTTTDILQANGTYSPIPVNFFGASYLSDQAVGLASNIASGQVDTAFVGIGGNDFLFHGTAFDTSGNSFPNPDNAFDQAFIDDISSSILEGVDTLLAATPEGGNLDLVLALLRSRDESGERGEAVAAINDVLVAGALERGIATVSLYDWTNDPGRVDENGFVQVGGLLIEPGTVADSDDISVDGDGACNAEGLCALDSHALSFTAEDNIHPNTIIQGLIANEVIGVLNSAYGHDIALLSDGELLGLAGITAVPIPAAAWLFGSALIGLVSIKRRKS